MYSILHYSKDGKKGLIYIELEKIEDKAVIEAALTSERICYISFQKGFATILPFGLQFKVHETFLNGRGKKSMVEDEEYEIDGFNLDVWATDIARFKRNYWLSHTVNFCVVALVSFYVSTFFL